MTALARIYDEPDAFVYQRRMPIDAAHSLAPALWDALDYVSFFGSDIGHDHLKRLAEGCLIHFVDVRSQNPEGFRFLNYEAWDGHAAGRDLTGSCLGDKKVWPCRTYAQAVQEAYVKAKSGPTFGAVTWKPSDSSGMPMHRYLRGIVPINNGNELAVFVQFGSVGLNLVDHFSTGNELQIEPFWTPEERDIDGRLEARKNPGIAIGTPEKSRLSRIFKHVPRVVRGLAIEAVGTTF